MPTSVLISAGPTHEPIDAVRFLGNRSSGRVGVELASAAAERGWDVTLLLGPSPLAPVVESDSRLRVERFLTTAELGALLEQWQGQADLLILAAAVAYYRPAAAKPDVKIRRSEGTLTLQLEPTPDLAAACAARRRGGQRIVAFALERRDHMIEGAQRKLHAKSADLIVRFHWVPFPVPQIDRTTGAIDKRAFAEWLLDRIAPEGAG